MSIYLLNEEDFINNDLSDEDIDHVKKYALEGDQLAQYHLALLFDTGKGVARNPTEAKTWYKKSAEQGNPDAQYFLARMYSIETSGIEKDTAEAKYWYNKAANQGHIDAMKKISN